MPQVMGCGFGMTCWGHLKEWQEAGVWERNKMPDFDTRRPRELDQHEDWLKSKVRAQDG